jgi:hypothetical protein
VQYAALALDREGGGERNPSSMLAETRAVILSGNSRAASISRSAPSGFSLA